MGFLKLTVDFFILAIAVTWPVVHSDVCGEDDFLTFQYTNMPGATLYPDEVNADACKTKCLQENGCKAIDWNFVDSKCWLHFKFDMQLRTDQTVTQYYNCKNGPLPISTEDPLTAGFPATNRSHAYHPSLTADLALPIVILQPPLTAAAAFSGAMVQNVEFYVRREGEGDAECDILAGIARPNEGGFDLVSLYDAEVYIEGRIEAEEIRDNFTQPGDAIYVGAWDHIGHSGDSDGIAYDVGTPDVCGVTSIGRLDIMTWTIVPNSLEILDECWMMSVFFNLSPLN